MNKIFKVVYSKSKECYVVVSEFAKNNSGKKKIVVAGIFAALAMTNASVSFAANTIPGTASATSVAFGSGADVSGTNSVGLGTNVKASKNDVVAIGTDANADFDGGIAIGQNSYSVGRDYAGTASVAVGRNSIAKGGTAIAIGTSATVNSANNPYSQGIAIGGGVLPDQGAVVVGDQGIAIGGNTKALGHSSIVIGGDDADKMTQVKAVYTDINSGKATVGTISTAVKALTGYEIKSGDYINATADHIGITVGNKGESGNAGIAIGTGADSKNRIAGSLTGVNTSGADNTSVTNAIAIGTGAKANRDNSVALGGGSTTDIAGTKQTSYTLPSGVVAKWKGGENTLPGDIVSFGSVGFERQLKNVAPGEVSSTSTDAINGSQLAAIADQLENKTEAIGRKIYLGGNTGSTDEKSLRTGDVKFNIKGENGLTTVANGEDVTVKIDDKTKAKIDNAANQDLSNLTDAGKQQVKDLSAWNVTAAGGTIEKVQGGDTVKFQAGDNLEVKQDNTAFTYRLAKDVKGLNSVTVGDENGPSTKITPAGTTVKDAAGNSTAVNGAGMTINPANSAASPVSLTVDGLNNGGNQIHGVAPGTADTDVVNVSQLKGAQAGVQEAINRVGVETQRVGAHAAAMAALKPIQYDPLEPTQIMAGIGNYRGEIAGAIGIAHYKTEDTMFNIGVTLGSSHNMINAGVTHKFGGSRNRKDAVPERYKAGPISSIYVMQDEVSHLRSQNEEYKSKLEQQQFEIDALKAAVNQFLGNKA